jgi:hypothetical protein
MGGAAMNEHKIGNLTVQVVERLGQRTLRIEGHVHTVNRAKGLELSMADVNALRAYIDKHVLKRL